MSAVTRSIGLIGLTPLARRFRFRPSAIQKWRDDGRLPQSELAGLTNYASVIAELSAATAQPVTAEELLRDTRAEWVRRPSGKRGGRKTNGRRKRARQ